ncbi:MAG: hypothetical protein CL609_09070 [Anaerolineaceae bacterium]|nr:hypothetical protein [Anaerolineaceae bacterium]
MADRFDVIIVGAGPSGSVAAANLAKYGLKTALIDKETFPRYKSCGDGITADGLAVLDKLGLGAWAEQFPAFEGLRFSSPDQTIVSIPLKTDRGQLMGRTIPRHLFDNQIAQFALQQGAKFMQGIKVNHIEYLEDGVLVKSENQQFEGQFLILAEGSNAPLAKSLGLVTDGPELMAARQYLTGDAVNDPFLEVHFQSSIIPGYNWMFPVGNGRINIGTGTFQKRIKNRELSLREELERFKSDPILRGRLDHTEPDSPIEGHPLRTQFGYSTTHSNRTLLVGDAAGLVNPFTGVGIGPGMMSGDLAAKTIQRVFDNGLINTMNLSDYTNALNQQFASARKAAQRLRKFLSSPSRLNNLFSLLKQDPTLAALLGDIFFDKKPATTAFRLETLFKVLPRL